MVLAVVGLVALRPLFGSHSDTAAANADGQTTSRPGYSAPKGSVADPDPLKQVPAPATSYQGTPVVQACNVLGVDDLRALGINTDPNAAPDKRTFERTYIAGDGSAPLDGEGHASVRADSDVLNKCVYGLSGRNDVYITDHISIGVSQDAYYPGSSGVEKYQGERQIGATHLTSHVQPGIDPGDQLGAVDMYVHGAFLEMYVSLSAKGYASKLEDLITKVADNLQKQIAAPAGPSSLTYDSKTYPKPVVQPCPMITEAVYDKAFHTPMSPLVVERPATAVRRTDLYAKVSPFNSISIDCFRGSGQQTAENRQQLEFQVSSYLTENGAKQDINVGRTQDHGEPLSTPLGDEAIMYNDPSNPAASGVISIRQGRFILLLRARDKQHPDGFGVSDAQSMLVPAAQEILRNFHDR